MLAWSEKPWTLAQRGPVSVRASSGGVVAQGIMLRGHHVICASFQVTQPLQCADDAPADLLDHGGNVGIGGRLGRDKPRLEALVRAIEGHPLQKDAREMEVDIERAPETLQKGDRPWLEAGSLQASGDSLVHIILRRGLGERRVLRRQAACVRWRGMGDRVGAHRN